MLMLVKARPVLRLRLRRRQHLLLLRLHHNLRLRHNLRQRLYLRQPHRRLRRRPHLHHPHRRLHLLHCNLHRSLRRVLRRRMHLRIAYPQTECLEI